MASVRARGESKYWFACFKIPTGKVDEKGRTIFRRVQRSTGTDDKTRAEQLAISYERVAVLAAEKQFTDHAARRFLQEIAAISGAKIADVEATDVYLRRWVKSRGPQLSASSRLRYESVVEHFLKWLGDRATAPLIDISAQRVAEFRDAETAAGKTPVTVNKSLMILGQAFAEPVRFGIFDQNPAKGLNVRGANKQKQRRAPFTFDQFRALVQALGKFAPDQTPVPEDRQAYRQVARKPVGIVAGDWLTLVLLCAYTGARQQEAAQLAWEQVDLKGRRLTLERTKTGDEHWIPLHPTLHTHLRQLARRAFGSGPAVGPVGPSIARVPRRVVSNVFRRSILPLIGIKQAYGSRPGVGRQLAPLSIHSLRHSLSTWLQQAGVEEMMRMQIVGHEDESVNRGYTHSDFKARAAALARVPSI